MGLWDLIAIAVVGGILLEGYKYYTRSQRRGAPALRELEERVEALEHDGRLEERVRALESIVTDTTFQLDREIRDLDRR